MAWIANRKLDHRIKRNY